MKEYYKYEGDGLKQYVLFNKDKEAILTDIEFKDYLLRPENHYSFIWIVQDLSSKEALILLDNAFLEKIINEDPRVNDKYNAILCDKSECLASASDKVISYILNESYLKDYLCYLEEDALNRMFDYIIEKEPDKVNKLGYFGKRLIKVLNVDNIDKLMNIKKFDNVFYLLEPEAIVKFLSFDKYRNMIYDLNNEAFIKFCARISSVSVEDIFLGSTTFFVKVATMENPSHYRYVINELVKNNYELVNKIEKYRKLYVEKQVSSVRDGIFESYHQILDYINKNGIDEVIYNITPPEMLLSPNDDAIRALTRKRQFEMLCDLYFNDYARNVLYNLKEVIRFNQNKDIVPKKRIDLYNKFISFEALSQEDIIELLYNGIRTDYASLLYDDIRNSRNAAFNEYNEEFLKPNEEMDTYDKDMSGKYGCEVHVLDGQPFFSCVHCGYFMRSDVNNETISLSFIGTENVGVFNEDSLILGFDYLDPERIMHVFNNDSYTTKRLGSKQVNKIYDPHDLLRDTRGYNEILYKQEVYANLKPRYVVCMDKINENSYKYAREHGLPIVIINRQKYHINTHKFDTDDKYQTLYDEGTNYFAK